MTFEQFTHIAKEIKPFTDFIYFHVKGEPLMHPLLEQFLDIALAMGLRVNLTTNGTLLAQRKALLLSHKAVRQVNLSIHSLNEHSQAEYLEQCVEFAKLANEQGIYVVLRLWNLDKHGNVDDNSKKAIEYIESQFKDGTDYPFPTPIIEKMGGRQSVKIARHSFVGWEQEFEWPSLASPFVSERGYCYGMRHQIAILVDGTVVPCCLDANGEEPLGNIYQTSFDIIINTKKAKMIRHGFEDERAVAKLCQHCSFRTKFNKV